MKNLLNGNDVNRERLVNALVSVLRQPTQTPETWKRRLTHEIGAENAESVVEEALAQRDREDGAP